MRTKDLILLEQAYLQVAKKTVTLNELQRTGTSEPHWSDPSYAGGAGRDPYEGVPEGDILDAVISGELDYDRDQGTYTDRRGRVFKYNENTGELEQAGPSQQG
jgi:hypothetical protein